VGIPDDGAGALRFLPGLLVLEWIRPNAPGALLFYSAVLKGKPARPVPIAEAQRACPKEYDSDQTRN
jgi:hypothetical protein